MNVYAFVIAAPVDLLTGANFVFLREPPNVNFGPIKLLPPWPWYIPVIDLFFLLLYWVLYQPFHSRPEKVERVGTVVDTGGKTGE
jgi:uncharacterized membrane protein YwaF